MRVERDGPLHDVFRQVRRFAYEVHDHADFGVSAQRTGKGHLLLGRYAHSVIKQRNVVRPVTGGYNWRWWL